MEAYNETAVSEHFLWVAEAAHRYVQEVRGKLKSNSSYEHVHDDHLAKFYVYNYLHGKMFLVSLASLLAELSRLQASTHSAPREALDASRFEQYRQSHIADLIERYENLGSN